MIGNEIGLRHTCTGAKVSANPAHDQEIKRTHLEVRAATSRQRNEIRAFGGNGWNALDIRQGWEGVGKGLCHAVD